MNLHNDLQKANIPHSCESCCRKCVQTTVCENFYPANMTEFMDGAVKSLQNNIERSREKRLMRHAISSKVYNDKVSTLDYYYVLLVNTVLAEIRKGNLDYVYSFEQIRDVMRFEPNIQVRYIACIGAYEIRIAGE